MGEHSKSSIIKYTRKYLNMTQEELAENRQYIRRLELILEDEAGKITNTEYIKSLEAILKLTFKDYNEEHFPVHRIFTENEILIISNIARQYAMMEDRKRAIHIYYNLEEYFQTDVVINDYKPRYLELVNLSNLLGLSGRYDESMEICKRGIQWLLRRGKSNYLCNFYYNMGWLINEKIKSGEEDPGAMKLVKCYMWLAYQLCRIYPENKNISDCIFDFCKENFS